MNESILPLFLIGGCKGGVGKSMVGEALMDDLLQRGLPVLLVKPISRYRTCGGPTKTYRVSRPLTLDLDEVDGWIVLSTTLSQHPHHVVVINTAARNDRGIVAHGPLLTKALAKLNRPWSPCG